MCWNDFLTNDLCSPFHKYLSEYFESVNDINFPRNYTSGASIWAQEWGNSDQNWVRYDFSKLALMLLQQLQENRTLLAPHSHQYFHLMHKISPKAKIRSRFMILCQPSLNDLPFIFPPPLLYIPSSHSFQDKNPFSSPLLSSSEVE